MRGFTVNIKRLFNNLINEKDKIEILKCLNFSDEVIEIKIKEDNSSTIREFINRLIDLSIYNYF